MSSCGPALLGAQQGRGSCGLTRCQCVGVSRASLLPEAPRRIPQLRADPAQGRPLIASSLHRREKQSPQRRGSFPGAAAGHLGLKFGVNGFRSPLVACGLTLLW